MSESGGRMQLPAAREAFVSEMTGSNTCVCAPALFTSPPPLLTHVCGGSGARARALTLLGRHLGRPRPIHRAICALRLAHAAERVLARRANHSVPLIPRRAVLTSPATIHDRVTYLPLNSVKRWRRIAGGARIAYIAEKVASCVLLTPRTVCVHSVNHAVFMA